MGQRFSRSAVLGVEGGPQTVAFAGQVLDLLTREWVLEVVESLSSGAKNSSELFETVRGISNKDLLRTLDQLVRDGLVERGGGAPHRPEYRLTSLGQTLGAPIRALACWGDAHIVDVVVARSRFDTGPGRRSYPWALLPRRT